MGELTISEVIQQTEERFSSIAPSYMKYDAEKGFAIQLLNNNDYLKSAAKSCPQSLQQAITNVAAIGLSLNPAEKLAYLIPRNVKAKNKYQTRVFLEPSYVGLIRLATDSGSIRWVQAEIVHANDNFVWNGPGKEVEFSIAGNNAFTSDRGDIVGVFCSAKTLDGDYLNAKMTMAEIEAVRDRSEGWKSFKAGKIKSTPWDTDFAEMAKKTVIRQAFKTWPRTDERRMQRLAQAVHLSNENEGFEPILSSPSIGQYTADQKAFFDGLLEKSNSLGMYVFQRTIEESVFNNLYHSFERGSKGKYQRLIDELLGAGRDLVQSIALDVEHATQSGDEPGLREIVDELTGDELSVLKEGLTEDAISFINEITDNKAAQI